MDITGVSSRFQPPTLPSIQDLSAVLAARPSMAELSRKAAAEAATGQDPAEAQKLAAATVYTGQVDLYL